MIQDPLTILSEQREHLRRSVLLGTLTLALAVVLIPTSFRAVPSGALQWVLLGAAALYVLVVAYRLIGCFQVERQLGFEYRFLRFAADRGRLLDSAEEAAKIWRLSAVVHGIRRTLGAPVPAHEGPRRLRRDLKASAKLLMPPSFRTAAPALILLALSWIATAISPGVRLDLLLLLALPTVIALGYLEFVLIQRGALYRETIDAVIEGIVERASLEWMTRSVAINGKRFRHRVVFRDPLRLPD